jgi:hypothetical protein
VLAPALAALPADPLGAACPLNASSVAVCANAGDANASEHAAIIIHCLVFMIVSFPDR